MKKYDFALCWSGNIKEDFVRFLQAECKKRNMSFLWINVDNYRNVIKKLESHELFISVLLDTEATYNKLKDPWARICYGVKDAGGTVINDPDLAKSAIDKSISHFKLSNAGISTPYTVIVRNWEPKSFKLTPQERRNLGLPFVIKPALGFGQQGVLKNAKGTVREIALARKFDQGDNFLLQEKVIPQYLNNKRAWFRIIHVFGSIIPCWWDDLENYYKEVSDQEIQEYELQPIVEITRQIADITKMDWFSTEIALDQKDHCFKVIDYVNDQCDMSTKSETPSGVPDKLVEFNAWKIVQSAKDLVLQKSVLIR